MRIILIENDKSQRRKTASAKSAQYKSLGQPETVSKLSRLKEKQD